MASGVRLISAFLRLWDSDGTVSDPSCSIRFSLTSTGAAFSADIVRRADFVSGRDGKSVAALSTLLRSLEGVRVPPSQVRVVRDPVLSDQYLTDTNGSCWKERLGE